MLELLILGPLEAREGNDSVPLGGPKQRALLAILLLGANQPVSVDRLVDELWGDRPPGSAAHSVEVYVSQLRKALGSGAAIVTQRPGYRLDVDQQQVDLHRFERLLDDGREALAAGDPAAAGELLRDALGLWRGPPLADFTFDAFAQPAIVRLAELRLAALEERVDADMAVGRHAELIGELETLVEEYPLRERLRGQLMRSLYRSGRQAEALQVYAATRSALVEQLGIEPTPALQRLERDILNHAPELEWGPIAQAGPRRAGPLARPASGRSILLVGRDERELDSLLEPATTLARSRVPHELILVRLLAASDGATLRDEAARLESRRAALLDDGVTARAAAFTAADLGAEVVRLGSQQDVDLLLLDARDSPAGPFSAEMAAVLDGVPCDVALLAGNGSAPVAAGAVVVPFGGGEHDWSALELGAWLATGPAGRLVVCGAAADEGLGRRDASRLLATASLVVQQLAGVAAEPVLTAPSVEGVVEAAAGAQAVVIGCSLRWRSEGLGSSRAAIAAAVAAPCLVVRRGLRPGGLSPPESTTRFTWSLAGTRPV